MRRTRSGLLPLLATTNEPCDEESDEESDEPTQQLSLHPTCSFSGKLFFSPRCYPFIHNL
jgi:hypothetical protein